MTTTLHLVTYHSIDNGDDHYLFETQAQAFLFVKAEIEHAIKTRDWKPRMYDRGDDEPPCKGANAATDLATYIVLQNHNWPYDDDLIYTYEPIDIIHERVAA